MAVLMIVGLILYFAAVVIAYWGPRKSWVRLTAITGLLGGFLMGYTVASIRGGSPVALGILLGMFWPLFCLWGGYWTRRYRDIPYIDK